MVTTVPGKDSIAFTHLLLRFFSGLDFFTKNLLVVAHFDGSRDFRGQPYLRFVAGNCKIFFHVCWWKTERRTVLAAGS